MNEDHTTGLFELFFRLCKEPYSLEKTRTSENVFWDINGSFEKVESKALVARGNGEIQLWRCLKTGDHLLGNQFVGKGGFVVVIRATCHSVVLDSAKSEAFSKIVTSYMQWIEESFDTITLQQSGPFNVTFTGHSFGASVAEALAAQVRMKQTKDPAYYLCVNGAVTFDSSGESNEYRGAHVGIGGFNPVKIGDYFHYELANVLTLNSSPNALNSIHPPCASKLWRCRQKCRLSAVDLLMQVLRHNRLFNSCSCNLGAYLWQRAEHQSLCSIQSALEQRSVQQSSVDNWLLTHAHTSLCTEDAHSQVAISCGAVTGNMALLHLYNAFDNGTSSVSRWLDTVPTLPLEVAAASLAGSAFYQALCTAHAKKVQDLKKHGKALRIGQMVATGAGAVLSIAVLGDKLFDSIIFPMLKQTARMLRWLQLDSPSSRHVCATVLTTCAETAMSFAGALAAGAAWHAVAEAVANK